MREIRLRGKYSDKVALVDDADYDLVKDHNWYFNASTGGVFAIIGARRFICLV